MTEVKIVATFFVNVDALREAYEEDELDCLDDLLKSEFGIMEENGVQLDDWMKVERNYDIRKNK